MLCPERNSWIFGRCAGQARSARAPVLCRPVSERWTKRDVEVWFMPASGASNEAADDALVGALWTFVPSAGHCVAKARTVQHVRARARSATGDAEDAGIRAVVAKPPCRDLERPGMEMPPDSWRPGPRQARTPVTAGRQEGPAATNPPGSATRCRLQERLARVDADNAVMATGERVTQVWKPTAF